MSSTTVINLRPQHPAVHRVLRIVLETNGEFVKNVVPEIRYLHRRTKKLCKYNEYYKITPFFDKFDYVRTLMCKHSYVLAVKNLLEGYNANNATSVNNLQKNTRFLTNALIQTIYNNLTHISSHLLALTTSAMNIRVVAPFLFAFEEREDIAAIFKNISRAKIHTALYYINRTNFPFTIKDIQMIKRFIYKFSSTLIKIYELLSTSRI
jgi:NADH-quinone oxidoreductase subunit D